MKLANKVCLSALTMLTLVFAVAGQDNRNGLPLDDPRNTAPSVGTGGVAGGPTGLFTVYDGKTLRRGEYTFSAAYSNYDRDPGDVDITSVPFSFQFGVTNRLELYVGTEAWRGVKVNSPSNLSGFYLPNSQLIQANGSLGVPAAIVLAPGTTGRYSNTAVFRPSGAPFCVFPYTGCTAGSYGAPAGFGSGLEFGFTSFNATLGPPRPGGATDLFPGVGSVYGSILPGFVLTTTGTACVAGNTANCGVRPVVFSAAPSYLGDAPFINRRWGTSSFNTIDFGAKWRINNSLAAVGYGFVFNYRMYLDHANDPSGFNMMQRGSGPGSNGGDISTTFFIDGRLSRHVNLSANAGYTFTTNPKGTFGGTDFVMLDRPDEINLGIGVDFPINRHFQPILEFHHLHYVGGHTPNALENNPYEGLAGARFYPARWWGFSAWYRYHFNQQDDSAFDDTNVTTNVFFQCGNIVIAVCTPTTFTTTSAGGVPQGFRTSSDPHGFGFQIFAGRRLPRVGPIVNVPANVESVTLGGTTITLPCPAGTRSAGGCSDNSSITVATVARDPENDVLTYNYTVSGGRVVGTGANVSWDLSGVQAGTYTITAGVDDGCGVCGSTKTQTITVAACSDCKPICNCPTAPSIAGPSGVTAPGTPMTFTATSSGDVSYNWTVSAGTISSGQGTSSITVDTTGLAGQNVTATVTISGGTITPDCGCPTTASETSSVAAPPQPVLVDQYGKLTNDDVKARIDGFYTTLNNDPSSHGYIIIYGTPAQIKAARAQIDKAIAFRKYDPSRVTIVEGPPQGDEVQVKLYQVPAGAENPRP